ncbi:MAG: hypothetical protein ACRD1S_10085 [Vicinamibacterales bacterium]
MQLVAQLFLRVKLRRTTEAVAKSVRAGVNGYLKGRFDMIRMAASTIAALALTLSVAQAQTTISTADIQRLQDRVYDAGSEVSRIRAQNAELASRLQSELDELREEVIYLKVKLRKEGNVPRADYTALRDRIDRIASRARGENVLNDRTVTTGTGTTGGVRGGERGGVSRAGRREIPVGQELDVRLQTELNSDTAQVEDRFEATTVVDLTVDGDVAIPAGSSLRGVVTAVDDADRIDRKGRLSLSFDQIVVNGRTYPMRASVVQALESGGYKEDAAKIGTAAGVGAIIGGILGGVKGALAGILIGGGGVIAATEGKDVVLPPGSLLRIRLDSSLALR